MGSSTCSRFMRRLEWNASCFHRWMNCERTHRTGTQYTTPKCYNTQWGVCEGHILTFEVRSTTSSVHVLYFVFPDILQGRNKLCLPWYTADPVLNGGNLDSCTHFGNACTDLTVIFESKVFRILAGRKFTFRKHRIKIWVYILTLYIFRNLKVKM